MAIVYKTGIGQDSHKFETMRTNKKLILGGVIIDNHPALAGNSDADVILHAITNAVSGVTGVNILGSISDSLCQNGITDSSAYLNEALSYLSGQTIEHVSISVECRTPILAPIIDKIKQSVGHLLMLSSRNVGMTATSGEGLTDFGNGLGIQCFAVVTIACHR